MRLNFRFLLLLALFLLTFPAARADMPAPTPTLANVAYGTDPKQVLDFYKAAGDQPTALFFFIHGGGWMSGDKAKPDLLDQCLHAGISVVSINYRLIPDAVAQGVNPPVKACLEDAARALQFVRSKAAEWNIDPTRIADGGGSAGGFSALWLAFHPDMADPKSSDPISHESTRVTCALTFVPQTSLDPQQMRQWIPNIEYGPHAFSLPNFQAFLDDRDKLMPWIQEYSPYALVTPDDPPVYLFYDSAVALGQPYKDPPHSANFGAGLVEKLKSAGVSYEFNYLGATGLKNPDIFSFLTDHLLGGHIPKVDASYLTNLTDHQSDVQSTNATVSVVSNGTGNVFQAEYEQGVQYPNVQFNMPGELDLAGYTGLSATVTNLGSSEVKVSFRVDNAGDWHSSPWNAEVDAVAPGETKTINITFGRSYGGPGFALDPARIVAVGICVPSPTENAELRIDSIAPFKGVPPAPAK
jgi:acetyl esterase/lipase